GLPLAFLLITGLGLGSALPSTPGYVGIYQFVAVSILTPFGITRTDAIAYILLLQAASYIVVTVWGLIALWVHKQSKPFVPVPAAT
ncbi:MAG: lysylphosphatidylglycerol synthase domain-containing protein, partial [Terriglobia bacterium]